MKAPDSKLIRQLEEAADALEQDGIAPVLVGGLAIQLRVGELGGQLNPDEEIDSPAVLASFGRATQDIDLAFPDKTARSRAELSFSTLCYQPDPKIEGRMTRGAEKADLLTLGGRRSRGGDFDLPIDRLLGTPLRLPDGREIKVATSAELVVLKAVSWRGRHAERDLADLATLAFLDLCQGGPARRAIGSRLGGLLRGDLVHDLEVAREKFATPDSPGPRAFLAEIALPLGMSEEDEETAQRIREAASSAVLQLLSGVS